MDGAWLVAFTVEICFLCSHRMLTLPGVDTGGRSDWNIWCFILALVGSQPTTGAPRLSPLWEFDVSISLCWADYPKERPRHTVSKVLFRAALPAPPCCLFCTQLASSDFPFHVFVGCSVLWSQVPNPQAGPVLVRGLLGTRVHSRK